LIRSIAELNANNGRILSLPTVVAILACRSFQRALHRLRRGAAARVDPTAQFRQRLQRLSLPRISFPFLDGLGGNLGFFSRRGSVGTISARRGGVNWKMGKLTEGQMVARPACRAPQIFSRR
jgi:hypothetical protein